MNIVYLAIILLFYCSSNSYSHCPKGTITNMDNTLNVPKPTLESNSKTESHLILEGDLIFAAKGTSNFCTVFDEKMGKAVASSSFLIIRITDRSIITPDYL